MQVFQLEELELFALSDTANEVTLANMLADEARGATAHFKGYQDIMNSDAFALTNYYCEPRFSHRGRLLRFVTVEGKNL